MRSLSFVDRDDWDAFVWWWDDSLNLGVGVIDQVVAAGPGGVN
jgi:hypothetical protein